MRNRESEKWQVLGTFGAGGALTDKSVVSQPAVLCCTALSSWCAAALHCWGVPIPKERHSANNCISLYSWELFPKASRERLERPWALSGGAAALDGGSRAGGLKTVAVSQGAQIKSIMMIYGRTGSLLFGSLLYGSSRSCWKVLLGTKGA